MNLGNESVNLVKHAFEDWRMTTPYRAESQRPLHHGHAGHLEIVRVREHIPSTSANRATYGFRHPGAQPVAYD